MPEPFLLTVNGYAKVLTSGIIISPYSGMRMAQNYPPILVQQFPPFLYRDIKFGISYDDTLPNIYLDEVCNELLLNHTYLY
jgi:hypothetical protein